MKYTIRIEKKADHDIRQIIRSANKSDIKKLRQILDELEQHPEKGTGRPEKLRYELTGCWSRRINKKDRLIYEINETEAVVLIFSAAGHYK